MALESVSHIRFRSWLWLAFFRHSIVPLLLVEALLVVAYLATNATIRSSNINYLHDTATVALAHEAEREAELIVRRLSGVETLLKVFSEQTAKALQTPYRQVPVEEQANYARNGNGVLHSIADIGGAASFYSAITPAEHQSLDKVYRLSRLDPLMKSLVEDQPLVVQSYFNSFDSYNRIYPFFDTQTQYLATLDIPSFNFYYLADSAHDPKREPVWTNTYLDPAGSGWMTSVVAPVYRGDFLEGVVGFDITMERIIHTILAIKLPWQGYALLLDNDMTMLAVPESGQRDFALPVQPQGLKKVSQETALPTAFNLNKRQDTALLARAIAAKPKGFMQMPLGGSNRMLAWARIPDNGWTLLTVVDENTLFANANGLAQRFRHVGLLMIAGLVLFYLVFFLYVHAKARRLSDSLSGPVGAIIDMVTAIKKGNYQTKAPPLPLVELQHFANGVADMGQALGETVAALEASETRVRQALENSGDVVWEYWPNNQQFLVYAHSESGQPPRSLSLRQYLDSCHIDDRQRMQEVLVQGLKTAEPFSLDYRVKNSAGDWIWLNARAQLNTPVNDPHPRVTGITTNISRRKAIESALKEARDAAEEASKAKSLFLSSVSHELKTPLHAISGFSQVLQCQVTDPAALRSVNQIVAASQHLNQLIEDLLLHVRLEKHSLSLAPTLIDLADVAGQCLAMMAPEAAKRQVVLHSELSGSLRYFGDGGRIKQVLLNLLSNAIKYNKAGGSVVVCLTYQEGNIGFEVKDTGIGIPNHSTARIFEPFERLGNANSAINGSGIGLAVSKELAELMGGYIEVSSKEGSGSTFTFWLPWTGERADEVS